MLPLLCFARINICLCDEAVGQRSWSCGDFIDAIQHTAHHSASREIQGNPCSEPIKTTRTLRADDTRFARTTRASRRRHALLDGAHRQHASMNPRKWIKYEYTAAYNIIMIIFNIDSMRISENKDDCRGEY